MKTRTSLRILALGIFAATCLFGQNCTFSVGSGSSQGYPASPGTVSWQFNFLATHANCAWQATTLSSWITSISPSSGTGSGTVTVSFSANSTSAVRSGVVSLASGTSTFALTGIQNPVACQFTAAPGSLGVPA